MGCLKYRRFFFRCKKLKTHIGNGIDLKTIQMNIKVNVGFSSVLIQCMIMLLYPCVFVSVISALFRILLVNSIPCRNLWCSRQPDECLGTDL